MKKKKNKKKLKNLIIRTIIVLIILAIFGSFVYYFLTAEDEENSLTLIEKQWIEKNKTTLININIPNNIDLIGKEGTGVLFDFLDYVSRETDLPFNKIPYNYPDESEEGLSLAILKNDDQIEKTDIMILEDNYVIVGKEDTYLTSSNNISGSTVGILENDNDTINNYFNTASLTIKTFSDVTKLTTSLTSGVTNYIIVPRYSYLSDIVSLEEVYVNYNLDNLSNKYVLRLGKNERLNIILTKMLENYLEKDFREVLESYFMNFYSNNSSFNEISRSNLTRKTFKYGYVKNDGYNVAKNGDLYGVASEYLNTLTNMTDVTFNYIEYQNKEDLIKDIKNNKLDLAFVNFSYENENYTKTRSPFKEELVALSNNYKSITDLNGLNNQKLYLKQNNYLYDYITENINKNVNIINSYETQIEKDSILVLDKNEYLSLKNSTFNDYYYLFSDSFNGDYYYLVKTSEEELLNILSFTLDNTNYNYYENISVNNLIKAGSLANSFKGTYMIILAVVLIPILLIFLCVAIAKNSNKLKLTRKENILKYNDLLTNLKNRNYLNDNIELWDNTKIYPRTIVIIDLNNLKYVNDNYGHEEGNELIKKAASILISTQLEKSEIIRTDGNEFLIYLIGYSKNQISSYVSSLSKEFEKLPYGFGAAIGYSSIEDEIKTIDDAINEATIDMRMDKEKNYR